MHKFRILALACSIVLATSCANRPPQPNHAATANHFGILQITGQAPPGPSPTVIAYALYPTNSPSLTNTSPGAAAVRDARLRLQQDPKAQSFTIQMLFSRAGQPKDAHVFSGAKLPIKLPPGPYLFCVGDQNKIEYRSAKAVPLNPDGSLSSLSFSHGKKAQLQDTSASQYEMKPVTIDVREGAVTSIALQFIPTPLDRTKIIEGKPFRDVVFQNNKFTPVMVTPLFTKKITIQGWKIAHTITLDSP